MTGIDNYYVFSRAKPSKAVQLQGASLALGKATSFTNGHDNLCTKALFVADMRNRYGDEIAAIFRMRAGLDDSWVANPKPLLVRDIKRLWDLEFTSSLAPIVKARENRSNIARHQLNAIGAAPFNTRENKEFRRRFTRELSRQMHFFQQNRDYALAKDTVHSLVHQTIREQYLERYVWAQYRTLMTLGLPADITNIIHQCLCALHADRPESASTSSAQGS